MIITIIVLIKITKWWRWSWRWGINDQPTALQSPLFQICLNKFERKIRNNNNNNNNKKGKCSSYQSLTHEVFSHIYTLFYFLIFLITFYNCIVQTGISPMGNSAFSGKIQLRQSRTTQPTVHARCFSVSIIHRNLTWTTVSLTCAQMLMHAIAYGGVRKHVRESSLKVDSWRKIPCRTGESNLRQQCDGPML